MCILKGIKGNKHKLWSSAEQWESPHEDRTTSRALFQRVGATFVLDTEAKWISISQIQNFVCMQYFKILKQQFEN